MSDLAARVETARHAWNAGDLSGYLTLYDDRIRLFGYGPEPFDKAGVRGFYEMTWASLAADGGKSPDLVFHDMLSDGDRCACRFTMSGVHGGPFMGIPPTGRPYVLAGITVLRFGPDRRTVVERHTSADMLGLMVQIGAVAPPG